jgi:hypothetical protein
LGLGDLTGHGFRSTFRDWCAHSRKSADAAEAALAHAPASKVVAWAALLNRPPSDVAPLLSATA